MLQSRHQRLDPISTYAKHPERSNWRSKPEQRKRELRKHNTPSSNGLPEFRSSEATGNLFLKHISRSMNPEMREPHSIRTRPKQCMGFMPKPEHRMKNPTPNKKKTERDTGTLNLRVDNRPLHDPHVSTRINAAGSISQAGFKPSSGSQCELRPLQNRQKKQSLTAK